MSRLRSSPFWPLAIACAVAAGASGACSSSGRDGPPRETPPVAPAGTSEPGQSGDDSERVTSPAFQVPDLLQRRLAIGATMSLTLRRALAADEAFVAKRPPDEGDWLAEHRERGQTFDQYVAGRPNRPDGRRSVLYLQPIGPLPAERSPPMDVLAEYVGLYFAAPVQVLPAIPVAEVGATSRKHPASGRLQLLSPEILAYLAKNLPDDAHALIGLTMTDLYPEPSWNYVFGQASLRERVGVYSFARYHPGFHGETADDANAVRRLVLQRSLKVMAHEIGHMYGIQHCIFYECVMNGSNSLAESDSQPMHVCPVDLHKLVHVAGFSPEERYRQLSAFYRRHGLGEEARFAERRQAVIERPDADADVDADGPGGSSQP